MANWIDPIQKAKILGQIMTSIQAKDDVVEQQGFVPLTFVQNINGKKYRVYGSNKTNDNTMYYYDKDTGKFVGYGDLNPDLRDEKTSIINNKNITNAINAGIQTMTNAVNDVSPGGAGGSGGSGGYSGAGYYEPIMAALQAQIDELKNPKVWTADELAELYGVQDQYDYNKILQMYNDATNDYYTSAIDEQNKVNKDVAISNALAENAYLNEYLKSYQNTAPTTANRAMLARNTLQTILNGQDINGELETNLNNLVRNYEQKRIDDLANNPILARDAYNSMGEWLLSQGAKMNTADVQNYINNINAYETRYTGIRNAQNTLAQGNVTAYQNNANAALYNAQAAQNDAFGKYIDLYYKPLGQKAADTAYVNIQQHEATKNQQKSSLY